MASKILTIKQHPTQGLVQSGFAKATNFSRSVMFGATQRFFCKKEPDGVTPVTGLNEDSYFLENLNLSPEELAKKRKEIIETRNRLSVRLHKDLSPTSSFWDNFAIVPTPINEEDDSRVLDFKNPADELTYIVGCANRVWADSIDDLKTNPYHVLNQTRFYIHDEEKAKLQYEEEADLKLKITDAILKIIKDSKKALIYARLFKINLPKNPENRVISFAYSEFLKLLDGTENIKVVKSILEKPEKEIIKDYLVDELVTLKLVSFAFGRTTVSVTGFEDLSIDGDIEKFKEFLQIHHQEKKVIDFINLAHQKIFN